MQAAAEQVFRAFFKNLKRMAIKASQPDSVKPQSPSIQLDELRTRADLYRWCDYLTKTVRIVDAYHDALDSVEDGERWQVNVQLEQFLCGMVLMLEEETPPGRGQREEASGTKPKRPWVPWRKQRHPLPWCSSGRHKHHLDLEALRREIVAARRTLDRNGDADFDAAG